VDSITLMLECNQTFGTHRTKENAGQLALE
jgi:hypothetical protein